MIDLTQYPSGTVLLVKCYDGGSGHVIIQDDVSEDNIKLVRELGCVADLHPNGVVKKILGNTGEQSVEWYNVTKIEAVLDKAATTVYKNCTSQACLPDAQSDPCSPEQLRSLMAMLIRELADSHKMLIDAFGKRFGSLD